MTRRFSKAAVLSLFLAVLMALSIGAGFLPQAEGFAVEAEAASKKAGVKLSKTKLSLAAKEKATLKLSGKGAGKAKWSSSNKAVVTVKGRGSKAAVTGKKAGTATITAKAGGKTVRCRVTVRDGLKISAKSGTITAGSKLTLKLSGKWAKKAKWTTSNKSVATVSGRGSKAAVTGKKAGRATVTATYKNIKVKCTVTVTGKKTNTKKNAKGSGTYKTGYTTYSKKPVFPKLPSSYKIMMPTGMSYTTPVDTDKIVFNWNGIEITVEPRPGTVLKAGTTAAFRSINDVFGSLKNLQTLIKKSGHYANEPGMPNIYAFFAVQITDPQGKPMNHLDAMINDRTDDDFAFCEANFEVKFVPASWCGVSLISSTMQPDSYADEADNAKGPTFYLQGDSTGGAIAIADNCWKMANGEYQIDIATLRF